jgi:hypothetical protein
LDTPFTFIVYFIEVSIKLDKLHDATYTLFPGIIIYRGII